MDEGDALRKAAELMGVGILRELTEGDVHEGAKALTRWIECGEEVGGKALMANMVEPIDRRVVIGVATACATQCFRRGGDDGGEDGLALYKTILTVPYLSKRMPKERERIVGKMIPHAARQLPSYKAFQFFKAAAKATDPAVVFAGVSEEMAPDNAEVVAMLLAHLAATHGVVELQEDRSKNNEVTLKEVKTAVERAKENRAGDGLGYLSMAAWVKTNDETCETWGIQTDFAYLRSPSANEILGDTNGFFKQYDHGSDGGAGGKAAKSTTHMSYEGKGLTQIDPLHFPCEKFESVRVLYLSDNKLQSFGEMTFPPSTVLTHFYAQHNLLSTLVGLDPLAGLKKLYIANNLLPGLDGIQGLTMLEELHASNQDHAGDHFDLYDADGVSVFENLGCLRVLKLRNVKLADKDLLPIAAARRLEVLDISGNGITSHEVLTASLGGASPLSALDVAGNPLVKQAKYRDALVSGFPRLAELSGSEVSSREHAYLDQLRRKSSQPAMKPSSAGGGAALPPGKGLAVGGKLPSIHRSSAVQLSR